MGINPLGGVTISNTEKYDEFGFWAMVDDCGPNKSGGDLANTKLFTFANDAVVKYDPKSKHIYFDNRADNAAYHPRWRTQDERIDNNITRYQLLKTIWGNIKAANEGNLFGKKFNKIGYLRSQSIDYNIFYADEEFAKGCYNNLPAKILTLQSNVEEILRDYMYFGDKDLEKVFKIEDFDGNGKPLTFRRISEIHKAMKDALETLTISENNGPGVYNEVENKGAIVPIKEEEGGHHEHGSLLTGTNESFLITIKENGKEEKENGKKEEEEKVGNAHDSSLTDNINFQYNDWEKLKNVDEVLNVYSTNEQMWQLSIYFADVIDKFNDSSTGPLLKENFSNSISGPLFGALNAFKAYKVDEEEVCSSVKSIFRDLLSLIKDVKKDDRDDFIKKCYDYFSPVVAYLRNTVKAEVFRPFVKECEDSVAKCRSVAI